MTTPPLPEQIELHRDRMWRRDEDLRVESAIDAKRFIEDVGFAIMLTDTRRAGPSFRHRGMRSALLMGSGLRFAILSDQGGMRAAPIPRYSQQHSFRDIGC